MQYMKRIIVIIFIPLLSLAVMSQNIIVGPRKKQVKEEVVKPTPSATSPKTQSLRGSQASSRPTTGTLNGHDWVDLGLSVKWATCNVGASSPSDCGDYFAWGETERGRGFTQESSKLWRKPMTEEGFRNARATYDAAYVKWKGTWRLPTKKEMKELVDNCTWTWTKQGNHNGYRVVSKYNGNSIFLPAASCRDDRQSAHEGSGGGFYWCSTPYEDNFHIEAYCLYFTVYGREVSWNSRCRGHSVRPVTK